MSSISLGQHAHPDFCLPVIANYATPLRTLSVDDANPGAVPVGERINISKSRYGAGNMIYIDVIAGVSGVTVALYKLIGTDYMYIDSQTTTKPKQELRFFDLCAGVYIPMVTSVNNPTVLNGGGTN